MRATSARSRLRNRLYLVGILPSILMLLVSARIVLLLQGEASGMAAYASGSYSSAREHFATNRLLTPIERWIAPLNEGDARYRLQDHGGAVAAFEVALRFAPHERECGVRINLALSHESIGDTAYAEARQVKAEEAWREGRAVLVDCLERRRAAFSARASDDPEGERAADASEAELRDWLTADVVDTRLLSKLDSREADSPPRPVPPADEATQAKQREIEERSRRAFERRERHRQQKADRQDARRSDSRSGAPPVPRW